jgi:hypothetical protein
MPTSTDKHAPLVPPATSAPTNTMTDQATQRFRPSTMAQALILAAVERVDAL